MKSSSLIEILTKPLAKKVDNGEIEKWAKAFWAQRRLQPTKQDKQRPNFVMMFPPPNITGNLHLGHAVTGTIQDALIRHRRMLNIRTLWIPGFDHAGLATQNTVEKLVFGKDRVPRQNLDKQKLIAEAYSWGDTKRQEMRNQLHRLGICIDKDREYFTLDSNSSRAVREAFIKLYNDGYIYRANKEVYWSNDLQTTLSDIEVKNVDGVNRYFRSGEIVERRSLPQWFISARDLAHKAVEVVQNGSIEMIPESYKNSWSSWLIENGIEDWCISRQGWWGHPIPVYRSKSSQDESWIASSSAEDAKSKLNCEVVQDQDVLDTWFSSSLLPLTVSGWPDEEKFQNSIDSNQFPLHIMETGFDILNFWVSKMVMMSIALTNRVPFKLILLHGMICDSDGKKMSKSKGNVIDPVDLMDGASVETLKQQTLKLNSQGIVDDSELESVLKRQKELFPKGIPNCGVDGLRGYLLSNDLLKEVIRVRVEQLDKIRRFTNKIWNLTRFSIALFDQQKTHIDPRKLEDIDCMIAACSNLDDKEVLEDLKLCIKHAETSFLKTFEIQHFLNRLEHFMLQTLSAKYIPNNKSVWKDPDSADRNEKVHLLLYCMITSVKLLHPVMPHLSEFLWQKLVIELTTSQECVDISNLEPLDQETFPRLNKI